MDWEALFVQQHIIWRYPGYGPHAKYTLSKKHSDFYFNSDYLISEPPLVKATVDALCKAADLNSAQKPDWIITYPPFGLNIAFCMADLLQCKFGYIQSLDQPEINFNVQSGETVLFCADDLYSGSSFRKVHHALIDVKAKIIEPLLVVANFSGMAVFDQYKVVALLDRNVSQWDEGSCPLCASGSAAISARENWQDLITAAGPQSRKAIQPEVK